MQAPARPVARPPRAGFLLRSVRRFEGMEARDTLESRPGWLLRGASLACLLIWLAIFGLLLALPGVTFGTYASALAMAGMFAFLLAGHQAAAIRVDLDGLSGRTLFRRMRCSWKAVHRVEVRPFFPGLTIFLVATSRGPLVFTSLWRNHGELLRLVRERAELA